MVYFHLVTSYFVIRRHSGGLFEKLYTKIWHVLLSKLQLTGNIHFIWEYFLLYLNFQIFTPLKTLHLFKFLPWLFLLCSSYTCRRNCTRQFYCAISKFSHTTDHLQYMNPCHNADFIWPIILCLFLCILPDNHYCI